MPMYRDWKCGNVKWQGAGQVSGYLVLHCYAMAIWPPLHRYTTATQHCGLLVIVDNWPVAKRRALRVTLLRCVLLVATLLGAFCFSLHCQWAGAPT